MVVLSARGVENSMNTIMGKLTSDYICDLKKRFDLNPCQDQVVVPFNEIADDLKNIPIEDWYSYAFDNEPLNSKFNEFQKKELAHEAIDCGYRYADELSEVYGSSSVGELVKSLGIKLTRCESYKNDFEVVFAEYIVPNEINIYSQCIKKSGKLFRGDVSAKLFTERSSISNVLIGHELFHAIEHKYENEIWTRQYEIALVSVGPLKYRSHVSCLSEIAAMAFTQSLNGISWCPYLLDPLLLYGYSPEAGSSVYRKIKSLICGSQAE